jgi:uncharacterized protein YbaP (TraB family)
MARLSSVTALAVLVACTACVTTEPLLRDDLSSAELEQHRHQLDAERTRLASELQPLRAAALSPRASRAYVWRVTSPHSRTSYLFGSIHLGVSWGNFPMRLHSCLEDADTIAFEVDLDAKPTLDAASIRALAIRKHTAGEPSISAAGGPAWERYRKEMLLLRESAYEDLKPTEALALYYFLKDAEVRGDDGSLDLELHAEAKALKKRLAFLETDDELQAATSYFAEATTWVSPAEFQTIFAQDPFASYLDHARASYERTAAYKTGDEAKIAAIGTMEGYDVVIRDRNERWVPRIEALVRDHAALIVTGVGHMQGPASLVKLLTAKGYSVERVDACEY